MHKSKPILITGGAGMIGSNLVKRLRQLEFECIVVDDLSRGCLEYLTDESGHYVIDIERDFRQLDLEVPGVLEPLLGDVTYVYHLADAVGGIDYVFNNQGKVFRSNILINSNVINSIKKSGRHIDGFIYVGTACSFPANLQTRNYNKGLTEEDQYPAAPESAYGWSKLMGEYESLLMESEYSIPVSVLSFHNVYGTPCEYEGSRAQVLPALIRKAVRYPEEEFVIWGSGKQGRAFIHVDDAVDALIAAMERGLGKGLIQVGPDKCTSIREVADIIIDISGKEIEAQYDTGRPEGDEWRYANYSKARELLGWEPSIQLKGGLSRMFHWVSRQI